MYDKKETRVLDALFKSICETLHCVLLLSHKIQKIPTENTFSHTHLLVNWEI